MVIFPAKAEPELANWLVRRGVANGRQAAWACLWLQSCGYPGLALLREALQDEQREFTLVPDALGLDLQNISCVFLGPSIDAWVRANGRVFLRNVRHGLFLLPLSVAANVGIGCPIDPAFAYGGARDKNPYSEKLALAARGGIVVDDAWWNAVAASA
jgi:hypothetical protein